MGKRFVTSLLALFLGASPMAALAGAEMVLQPAEPTVGQPVELALTDGAGQPLGGVPVVAIFRPGSRVSTTVDLGRSSDRGQLLWRPGAAGLVRLRAEAPDGSVIVRDVSVRFGGATGGGLLILVMAGSMLATGAVWGLRR